MNNVLYSAVPLDRAHTLRRDLHALEALRHSAEKLVVPYWRELSLGTAPAADPGGNPVFRETGSAAATLAHGTAAAELLDLAREVVFLGQDSHHRPYFAADISEVAAETDGAGPNLGLAGQWQNLRGMAGMLPAGEAALLGYARAMLIWHRRTRFCGTCGAPTESRDGGHMRQCLDSTCNSQNYPRTDPAVIMRVTEQDNILLHRQPSWPVGQWSVLAGFVEPGETLEEAVHREVQEETGILVADVAYVGSQPWPFPSSAMIAFSARAVGGTLAPCPHELDDARWFSRDNIVANFHDRHRGKATGLFLPTPGSIAHRMIQDWLAAY